MWRGIHTWLGLASLALVVVLALSGALLSVVPARDSLSANVQSAGGQSVADVLGRIDLTGLEPDRLERKPSGAVALSYFDASGTPQTSYVDVTTGSLTGPVGKGSPFWVGLKDFHRALFLRDTGRGITGIGAFALAFVSLAGVFVLAARMGGFARLFDRVRGTPSARWHSVISRIVLLPLMLSSLTGVYMVLTDFAIVPVTQIESLQFPESAQGLPPVQPGTLHGLAEIPLDKLIQLQFPFAGDTFDVFTATTASGLTLVDQFSGDVLETVPATLSMKIYAWFYALHTGEGMAIVGIILGLAALSVPVLGVTGVLIWWARRRRKVRIAANAAASEADIVVLVGSESGSTWGFARSLHKELTGAGHKVHTDAMNSFGAQFTNARHILFLTATYGNGTAPGNADQFIARLADLPDKPRWSFSVLGFGDRAFPHYCAFAKDVDAALTAQGATRALELELINRQSPQAFATWGTELGRVLETPLALRHEIELPPTHSLTLMERKVYGVEVQAPTAVLRFRRESGPRPGFWSRIFGTSRSTFFEPTDLLGILPPGSKVPRYYSVSSDASDDSVEICVRQQIGGECSGLLHRMKIGDRIEAFVKENPDFRPAPGRKPVIMVSAGTGIAPFVGLLRANRSHRPMHLFWGGRSEQSDFLYQNTLEQCRDDNRLTSLVTAFSRDTDHAYVQDRIRADADRLRQLIRKGGAIMVCGGDAMAQAVAAEFNTLLEPLGLTTQQLRGRKLYLEDIF